MSRSGREVSQRAHLPTGDCGARHLVAAITLALVLWATTTTHAQTAPSDGFFDFPLSGGAETLARYGIAVDERAHTISLLARSLYGRDQKDVLALARDAGGAPISIPVPLSIDAWRTVVRKTPLEFALFADRNAMLLAAGLTASDASVRELALRNHDWFRRIYRESAAGFAIVAGSLRIEAGRVAVPDGRGADDIWQSLVGTAPSRPAPFIAALIEKDDGRMAWYYDVISRLDATQLAAAWPDGSSPARLENARALYEAFREFDPSWQPNRHPYRRQGGDPSLVLTHAKVRGSELVGPSGVDMWTALFERSSVIRADVPVLTNQSRVSLTWMTTKIAAGDTPRERTDRFEMFRFAQRVFSDAIPSDYPDIIETLGGYRRYKAVLLVMERMGVRSPSTFATVVNAARAVDRADGEREHALAAFQGALAIVDRMAQTRAIDVAGASQLLRALAASVPQERRVPSAVARWIRDSLLAGITADFDGALITRLAGADSGAKRTVEWEGLSYTVSYAAAERDRLRRIFTIIGSPGIAAAIASGREADVARALTTVAYGIALGVPDGPVVLAPDIAARHQFRLDSRVEAWAWLPATEVQAAGEPWHVQGSLIGLDLALARLAMRHLSDEQLPSAPTLTTNDYATLARTATSMVPAALLDSDRDAIVAAIARGRARLTSAGHDLATIVALAREARLSSSAIELLPWMLRHTPEAAIHLFSLRDLMWLGKPDATAGLDHWGMLAQAIDARWLPAMAASAPWEDVAGRSETGPMITQMPDLVLRLAEGTAQLKLPATLIPGMMRFAVQDIWFATQTRFADDWLAMTKEPRQISLPRMEDYVAALAGNGPLRLPEARE